MPQTKLTFFIFLYIVDRNYSIAYRLLDIKQYVAIIVILIIIFIYHNHVDTIC